MNATLGLVMTVLLAFFLLVYLIGGVVSGLWLVVLGEWGAIGWGVVAMVLSLFGFGLAVTLGMALGALGLSSGERGNSVGLYFFILIQNVFTVAFMTAWCGFVFYSYAARNQPEAIIPVLLWSYVTAMTPFSYLASKHQESGTVDAGQAVTTLFAEVGYIIMILMVLFSDAHLQKILAVFVIIMLLGFVVRLGLVKWHRD